MMLAPTLPTTGLLRLPDVMRRVGLSRSELYRRIASGEFPRPVKLGARASGWVEAEVTAWVEGRPARCGCIKLGCRRDAQGDELMDAGYHVTAPTAEPLLARLDGTHATGHGWRARCPSCGGRSRKLSIAVTDARVLVNCFGGCRAHGVLASVRLHWSDLQSPSHWPEAPAQRRAALRALREVGWSAALRTVAFEATVIRVAAVQLARHESLDTDDDARLALACARIDGAATVLIECAQWRPAQ